MSATQYKLTYFNLRGLAEVSRLLFKAANVQFIDDRIEFEKKADGSFFRGKWEDVTYKKSFPFEQVPVLEVDGVQIAQSAAISRFLARRFNYFGANDIEGALIDALWEAIVDIRKGWASAKEKDGATPGENLTKFWTTSLPDQLALLERNAGTKGTDGHFVGSKLNLADIAFYYLVWVLKTENAAAVQNALSKNPKLSAIVAKVGDEANIKAWEQQRPNTIF